MLHEPIAAISTSLQDGAIAIVRMSGEGVFAIANALFSRDLSEVPSHTIHYGTIRDPLSGEDVDEVLVSVFRAPKTFTREDVVEINTHGGRTITRRILSLVLAQGARLARPGEFTQRAFLNGRIDLAQAEAINDMIQADSVASTRMAIKGIKGSVARLIEPLCEELVFLIANIEVNIDYPEYDDVEVLANETVLPRALAWKKRMEEILERAQSGRILKQGVKTVILGRPNVGKSSLLNALLEEDKAIVTDIAGTTRDLVEGVIHLKNITLHLLDTAGIRDTEDPVEKIGVDRSLQALKEAELVLLVLDGSQPLSAEDEKLMKLCQDIPTIPVLNKEDQTPDPRLVEPENAIWVSAKNQHIEPLVERINAMYYHHQAALDEPGLANERQIALAQSALQSMNQAIEALRSGVELDLVTIDLQKAYTSLKEILGKTSREDLLDALFGHFCLGK